MKQQKEKKTHSTETLLTAVIHADILNHATKIKQT